MVFKYLLNVPVALLALTAVVSADERVDAAIKAVDALAANSERLQRYCEIVPEGPGTLMLFRRRRSASSLRNSGPALDLIIKLWLDWRVSLPTIPRKSRTLKRHSTN